MSACLPDVHRRVGGSEQTVGFARVGRVDRDADAHVDPDLDRVDRERIGEQAADPLDHGLGELGRLLHVEVGQQDQELVAADAGDHVRGARAGAQQVGHLDERPVAVRMTERVVDLLEAVEVETEDGDGEPAATRACEREVELLAEHAAVRQLRQLVRAGEHGELAVRLLQAALDGLQVGDVRDRGADSDDSARAGDGVVADEMALALGVLDLDPDHGFPRLDHAAGERLEDGSVHRRELAQGVPLDLVPLVPHDLRERLVHAHVAQIAVEHTKAVMRVLEEGVELTPVRACDGDQPVEPRAKDDHCGGAADEDAAEDDRALQRERRCVREKERDNERDQGPRCLADRLPLRIEEAGVEREDDVDRCVRGAQRQGDDHDAEQHTAHGGEHLAHGHRGVLVAEQRRRAEQTRAEHAWDDDLRSMREVLARDDGEQQDRGATDVDHRRGARGDEPLVVGWGELDRGEAQALLESRGHGPVIGRSGVGI